MKLREFISLLGGTAVAWPLAARAQPAGLRRIGVLMQYEVRSPEAKAEFAAFREALGKLGWTEDHNIQFEYRWAASDPNRIQQAAKELTVPPTLLATADEVIE